MRFVIVLLLCGIAFPVASPAQETTSVFQAVNAPLGDDEYRNAGAGALSNGVTGRPVIADPVGTQINQALF